MARPATAGQMTTLRSSISTLKTLKAGLLAQGDVEAAAAVKRALRELETVDRQGLFKARGVSL